MCFGQWRYLDMQEVRVRGGTMEIPGHARGLTGKTARGGGGRRQEEEEGEGARGIVGDAHPLKLAANMWNE